MSAGDAYIPICTDAAHSNPLRRVTSVELIKQGREKVYDKEKYREILEAAETLLGYFGFDRTDYLEILVAAKTENGGISLGTSDRKTWMSKSLQTSNSAISPRHIGLHCSVAVPKYETPLCHVLINLLI